MERTEKICKEADLDHWVGYKFLKDSKAELHEIE